MKRRSLTTQFSLVIALLVTLSVGSMGVLALVLSRQSVRERVLAANLTGATLTARAIEQYVSDATSIMREAPRRPKLNQEIHDANWPEVAKVLENFGRHFAQFDAVFVLDPAGVVRVRVPHAATVGRDLSARDFFRQAIATRAPYISGTQVSESATHPVVSIAVPVLDGRQGVTGVLVGELSPGALSRLLAAVGPDDGSHVYVVDRNAHLIAHSAQLGAGSPIDATTEPIVNAVLAGRSGTMEFGDARSGEPLLGAHVPVARLGWGVVATQPTATATRPVDRLTRWLALTAIASTAAAIVVGWRLARRLISPLRRIADATTRLGTGETGARTGLPHDDAEVGQLARAFDDMAASLERQKAEAERAGDARHAAEASFAELLGAAPDAIVVTDDAQRIVLVNTGAEQRFGYTGPELVGQPLDALLPAHAVMARGYGGGWDGDGSRPGGGPVELAARRRDGTEFPVDATMFTLTRNGRANSAVILRDITERRRTDDALRESEARKAAILAAALDCVITIDEAGRILEFNPMAETTFGYTRAEVLGREMAALLVPPAHREAHRRGLAHYLATGKGPVLGKRLELTALRADGSEFPVELAIVPIRVGNRPEFTAYLRDVSARRQAEAAARALADVGQDLVTTLDFGQVADRIVRTVLEFFHVHRVALYVRDDTSDQLVCVAAVGGGDTGQWVGRTLPPGQSVAGRAVAEGQTVWIADLAESDIVLSDPLRASLEADGTHAIISMPLITQGQTVGALSLGDRRGRLFTDHDRRLMAAFADQAALALLNARQYEDAERRRRAAEILTERLNVLHAIDRAIIAAESPVAIAEAVIQRFRDLLGVPRAIVNVFDLAAGEAEWLAAAGRHRIHLGPGVRFPMTFMGDVDALRRGDPQVIRVASLSPSAETEALLASGVHVYMVVPMIAGGELIGGLSFGGESAEFPPEQVTIAKEAAAQLAIAIAQARLYERVRRQAAELEHRVSERTRELSVANEQLAREIGERRQAEAEADRANRAKSDFLSRMSHELRTPLNSILGFAQVLELEPLPAAHLESVDYILRGGRHLLALIDEVLDIARIESGHLRLSLEAVALNVILDEARSLTRPLAEDRHIRLVVPASPPNPGYVRADRQRLKQVLLNLLSNAIKYTPEGGTVTVACTDGPSPSRTRVCVSDTGPGIAPAALTRLFTPFDRLGAESTSVEGTGLGLALSRALAAAMGGAIGVESEVGRGSTFWVELDQVASPEPQVMEAAANVPVGPSLKADAKVLYIEDNLSNIRLIEHVLARRPGVRLLTALQGSLGLDLAREHRPSLILLDLHLPDIPGGEVLGRLRADPRTRALPVVVLSADASPARIRHLLEAGAHAYLPKPIDVRELLRIVDTTLADAEA